MALSARIEHDSEHNFPSLSSDELSSITSKLIGSCFNDDREELGEWIGAEFRTADISWRR